MRSVSPSYSLMLTSFPTNTFMQFRPHNFDSILTNNEAAAPSRKRYELYDVHANRSQLHLPHVLKVVLMHDYAFRVSRNVSRRSEILAAGITCKDRRFQGKRTETGLI